MLIDYVLNAKIMYIMGIHDARIQNGGFSYYYYYCGDGATMINENRRCSTDDGRTRIK